VSDPDADPPEIFLSSCIISLMRKPSIIEVAKAYRWKSNINGDILDIYPNGVPHILIEAMLHYDLGVQAGIKKSYERAKENAENKTQKPG
jgi:hypothetical protein